ncbi:hypothetical protein M9H77_22397 [Catharanthus roseus]|uniref:Uncharacterized protein n=1 Tax=Catharanthus roseus TaxID=4058 RepID=A0ACC0ASE7_CATRO|nr:hypothetical protein M9H77_22397 [Catharanthus roseus]
MSRGLALCVASPPVRGPIPNDMLGGVILDLDPGDRWRSTVGGLGPRRLSQEGPTSWGSTGRLGRYARTRYLFMYMSCEVEKSNVRTTCFRVQAGIDYWMPELVLMTPFKDLDFVR